MSDCYFDADPSSDRGGARPMLCYDAGRMSVDLPPP